MEFFKPKFIEMKFQISYFAAGGTLCEEGRYQVHWFHPRPDGGDRREGQY